MKNLLYLRLMSIPSEKGNGTENTGKFRKKEESFDLKISMFLNDGG